MQNVREMKEEIYKLDFSEHMRQMGIPDEDIPEMRMLFQCDIKRYMEKLKDYKLNDVPVIGDYIPEVDFGSMFEG